VPSRPRSPKSRGGVTRRPRVAGLTPVTRRPDSRPDAAGRGAVRPDEPARPTLIPEGPPAESAEEAVATPDPAQPDAVPDAVQADAEDAIVTGRESGAGPAEPDDPAPADAAEEPADPDDDRTDRDRDDEQARGGTTLTANAAAPAESHPDPSAPQDMPSDITPPTEAIPIVDALLLDARAWDTAARRAREKLAPDESTSEKPASEKSALQESALQEFALQESAGGEPVRDTRTPEPARQPVQSHEARRPVPDDSVLDTAVLDKALLDNALLDKTLLDRDRRDRAADTATQDTAVLDLRELRTAPAARPDADEDTGLPAGTGDAGATGTEDAEPAAARKPSPKKQPTKTQQREARGRGRLAPIPTRIVELVVALVLFSAAAVTFAVLDYRLHNTPTASNLALVDVAGTAEAAGQLSDAIETVYSFDYTRLDENEKAAREVITPEFAAEFDKLFAEVRQHAPEQQAVVSATVTLSAVKELTADHAVLVAFVDQQATRAAPNADDRQLAAAGRLTVTGEKVDGRWKIAAVVPR
jgi:Mce-associated membrane protein